MSEDIKYDEIDELDKEVVALARALVVAYWLGHKVEAAIPQTMDAMISKGHDGLNWQKFVPLAKDVLARAAKDEYQRGLSDAALAAVQLREGSVRVQGGSRGSHARDHQARLACRQQGERMKPEQLKDAIDQYFALEEDIKEPLGWVDSWKILPLEDNRQSYWLLAGDDKKTGRDCTVITLKEPITFEAAKKGEVSGSQIYTQRDHERWIFRAGGVVLIPVDTQTDGNVLLLLLDAAKEIKDAKIENCYRRHWGDGGDMDDDEDEDGASVNE